MSSDWFARKLGGQRPQAPQPQGPHYPPTSPVPQPYVQPQQFQQPHQHPQQPQPYPVDPSQLDPRGQTNMGDAIQIWKGGEGTKTEQSSCPQCGSVRFFSRRKEVQMGPNGLVSPAPICMDCGWNGLFEQGFGDPEPEGIGSQEIKR